MDEDDSEDVRETVTLMNRLATKVTASSTKFTSKTNRQILRTQESAEDSDTMECASENEVENLPKDEDASIKRRDRICERSRHSLDVPDDAEFLMTRKKMTKSSSLRVSDDSKYTGSRLGFFMTTNRSAQSSSSQEEYEPEVKSISRLQIQQQRQPQQQQQQQQQHLLTAGGVGSQATARSMESLRSSKNFLSADDRYSEDSKSMESLSSSSEMHLGSSSRGHYRSFLTSSTRDVRRIVTVESKSSENLHREESLNAEVRRGLFANTGLERKIPQHLSLPPPSNMFSLTSPGGSDRRIMILSPHSPMQASEFQFSAQTLKSRRKKAIVLPRLVLPRSESEVFLE
ncbi:camp-specific 3 -cyclic isoforms n g-like isoform x5 protein [Lasius niger]|uniref:Camp-specific 3-cyclic isoforms n g-like isoform x5 protein n=1 Tax=Lasius niger TaxID=67767 RepID=A0A0J7KUD4_LASNI|nr:camp-specific 3 -cyclic isoforms n g-like isoform x5 protein [Lasius niger]